MVRSANRSKRMISVSEGLTPCVTHHLPAVRSTHPTYSSASRSLRPPKGCRGPARRIFANAAPQFCRVGGARKFNGAFREPVEENDKRFQGLTPCVTHHLPAVRSTHPTTTLSASRPLRPPKGCRGPARRIFANAAPQFCRVGGARKFNGAFREPVDENDKRFQGFDSVRNPPFACGSLHAPYHYSFSLSAASAAQGLPGASARIFANAAPQFCRVGGARKFNGAFREPVEENDKRFQGFDSVRNPPFACGSLHVPYSYSFSLSLASAAKGCRGPAATNRRQCSSAVL